MTLNFFTFSSSLSAAPLVANMRCMFVRFYFIRFYFMFIRLRICGDVYSFIADGSSKNWIDGWTADEVD